MTATVTRNRVRYAVCKTVMRVEGYLLDLLRHLRGQDPAMGKIFERMISQSDVLKFFTFHEWTMRNDNMQRVWNEEVTEAEALVFPLDLTKVDWDEYYRNFVPGVVKYAIEPRKVKDAGKVSSGKVECKRSLYAIWSFIFQSLLKLLKNFMGH